MKPRRLRPRDLILDNHEREGIVVSRSPTPHEKWLKAQTDTRVRRCGRARWWHIIPLSGGAAVAPERYSVLLREATVDDLRAAVACAMPAGVTTLLNIFPELRETSLIRGRTLIAKSPMRSLRFRLERGDPSLTEPEVRRAEMLVVTFVERIMAADGTTNVHSALRDVVVQLNPLIGDGGISFPPSERTRLIAFLIEVAQSAGEPLAPDPTEEWRTW